MGCWLTFRFWYQHEELWIYIPFVFFFFRFWFCSEELLLSSYCLFCCLFQVLILVGRAVNIFPLSFILNFFREHKITRKNQCVMWFSGLRGAVAFALSLHLELSAEKRYVLVTATLIIVLFTIMFLGGATMPLLKVSLLGSFFHAGFFFLSFFFFFFLWGERP